MGARRAATLVAMLCIARAAGAQERLVGGGSWDLTPIFQQWSFATPLPQQRNSADTLPPRIRSASQTTLPFALAIPIGTSWTIDAYGAYAMGSVQLAETDSSLGKNHYALNGLTDIKLRATGRLHGDNVLLTIGANLPTGTVKLDPEQRDALSVLGAPALQFQSATLGSGFGATTGLVLARQFGDWAWALGTSYEIRGSYAPLSAEAFLPGANAPDLDPSDAIHISLGTDRLIGQSRMSIAVTSDFYGKDKLSVSALDTTLTAHYQLGPGVTGTWRLQLGSTRVQDLTLWAVDHYRSSFKGPTGATVAGSSGNDAEFGIGGTWPISPTLGVLFGVDGHYDSGLSVDESVATAAMADGGLLLGVAKDMGSLRLAPVIRFRIGTIDNGTATSSATGLSAGLTIGSHL
jgi:hypothetical protein